MHTDPNLYDIFFEKLLWSHPEDNHCLFRNWGEIHVFTLPCKVLKIDHNYAGDQSICDEGMFAYIYARYGLSENAEEEHYIPDFRS